MVRKAEIVRNPPKPNAEEKLAKVNYEKSKAIYKEAAEGFDRGVQQGWRYPEDKKNELWYVKNSLDNDRRKYHAHRDGRLNQIKWAAQDFISGDTSGLSSREGGGCYVFGQKKFVVVGGVTDKSFNGAYKVDANETDIVNMRRNYSKHLANHLPEKVKAMADTFDNFDVLNSPIGFSGKQTWAEKALSIHIHELGHAVDSFADVRVREIPETVASRGQKVLSHINEAWSGRTERRPEAVKQALREKRGPSVYALTNDAELFAESFAAYVFAPRALKRHHPDLHAWVDERLKSARTTMAKNGGLRFVEER
jgi:hypothetical protein